MCIPTYDRIPEHCREGARRYVEDGKLPGAFLQAVLCNDLVEAHVRADDTNRARIIDWVLWLYDDIPSECWGSRERVKAWIEGGGLHGRQHKEGAQHGRTGN